ncbi:hypothetical protein Z043_124266 [Scleropages formosus]|uniref:CARD domain-containing protein n=1 Tax=Scleropages formosus TaxID=113540 RepID=A0A0P7TW40_SCLFO|nr:hypothetical protein Z043_124266 [Scleropages formosus]
MVTFTRPAAPGQRGDNAAVKSTVTVTGGSHFCGPIIHNSHAAEDVNICFQVRGASQVQGPPKEAQPPRSSIEDKRGFLRVNFSKLVDRVTNVDSIVDELRSKGIHRELAANVYAEKTEQAKMRRLLDNTKSSAMADALLTALFAQQPLLMNELLSGHRA